MPNIQRLLSVSARPVYEWCFVIQEELSTSRKQRQKSKGAVLFCQDTRIRWTNPVRRIKIGQKSTDNNMSDDWEESNRIRNTVTFMYCAQASVDAQHNNERASCKNSLANAIIYSNRKERKKWQMPILSRCAANGFIAECFDSDEDGKDNGGGCGESAGDE